MPAYRVIYTVMIVMPIIMIFLFLAGSARFRGTPKQPKAKEWLISVIIIDLVLFIVALLLQRL